MGLVLSTVQYIFGSGQEMDTPDATTGLTEREKGAIRDSWALVNADIKTHGVNLLIKFFQDYPSDYEFFTAFKGQNPADLRDNSKMRAHATMVMTALGTVVDSLNDTECLMDLLKKNAQSHFPRNIRVQQYKDLFETFGRFLQETFGDKVTPLTKESWEKALAVVAGVIGSEMTAMSNGQAK